jgi:hypothetical protein
VNEAGILAVGRSTGLISGVFNGWTTFDLTAALAWDGSGAVGVAACTTVDDKVTIMTPIHAFRTVAC